MSAGYKIKWSARAADDFEQIIRYLSENWNSVKSENLSAR